MPCLYDKNGLTYIICTSLKICPLARIVEKDGTMSVINKPGWIWFNLLEMKWFSFILLFAIIYAITFITFGGLFHLLNISHTEDVHCPEQHHSQIVMLE